MSGIEPNELVTTDIWVPTRTCLKSRALRAEGFDSFLDWAYYCHHVYIGRGNKFIGAVDSKWKNPFRLKDYNREDSLLLYTYKVRNNMLLMNSLPELEGKTLGCFCPHDVHCHGQVLISLFREKYQIPDIIPNGQKFTIQFNANFQDWLNHTGRQWIHRNEREKQRLYEAIQSRYMVK